MRMTTNALLAMLSLTGVATGQNLGAPWDSVAKVLKTPGTLTGGYYRYGFPRRDLTLKVGDVTVATSVALGGWAGFSGNADDAMMMGDLVVTGSEIGPVMAELDRQHIDVTAIHHHIVGEPQITQIHIHAQGRPLDIGARLSQVVARTGVVLPPSAPAPGPVTIDTGAVFKALGASGRAQGNVAQVGLLLVPGKVMLHGREVPAAMGYNTPINIQMVSASRAVATGDFSVLGDRVAPVLSALALNGITATALHTHMVGEEPKIYYIHFWADADLTAVLSGLRAAIAAGRSQ